MGNCCVSSRELHKLLTLGYYLFWFITTKDFHLTSARVLGSCVCEHDVTLLLIYLPLLLETCHQEMQTLLMLFLYTEADLWSKLKHLNLVQTFMIPRG